MSDIRPQGVSEIGKTIADRYMLVRVLGIGGMGTVFEAMHTVTLRRVAVKLIHNWVMRAGQASAARFLREAQAAASIGHPSIVDVLDAGTVADGSLYLVFELLDGEELETLLAKGGLDAAALVDICVAVLDGLSAAHRSGFIHRDIKPANIFIARSRSGQRSVKILDFGIAKRMESGISSVTAQGAIIGTLEYMAPEQATGANVDGRADLWSVGALLFRALAGQPPFVAPQHVDLIEMILRDPVPSLALLRPDLPQPLIAIIERALERDLSKRWQSAAAMRDALEACARGQLDTPVRLEELFVPTPPSDPIEAHPFRSPSSGDPGSSNPFAYEPSFTAPSGQVESVRVPVDQDVVRVPSDETHPRPQEHEHEHEPTQVELLEQLVTPVAPDSKDDLPRPITKTISVTDVSMIAPATASSEDQFSEEATATAVELSLVRQPVQPISVPISAESGPTHLAAGGPPSRPDFEISKTGQEETVPPPSVRESDEPKLREPSLTPVEIELAPSRTVPDHPPPYRLPTPVPLSRPENTAARARVPVSTLRAPLAPSRPEATPISLEIEPRSSSVLTMVLIAGVVLAFLAFVLIVLR